jgi:hypothetical protein
MLELLKFSLASNHDFVVINGLVVPLGSQVSVGLQSIELPSNEEVLKNFKMLFGIKKKIRAVEEDEPVVAVKDEDELDEDSIEESDSNSEEEIEDDED